MLSFWRKKNREQSWHDQLEDESPKVESVACPPKGTVVLEENDLHKEDESSSHRPISEAKNMSEEMVRGPLRSPCLGESNSAYLTGAEACVQCKF